MELQSKAINQEELDLEERKKDIEQERKMIELNENQIKKYQQEISDSKETLRKLKLEAQKQLLEQEDTSSITAELEQLISQKQIAEDEIQEIKIQKNKILSKADETIKSAREIKQVLGNHKENKEKIEELKSEICINIKQFEKLKYQIQALEATNKDLDSRRENLESSTANLESQTAELESEKAELLNANSDLESLVAKLEAENEELRNTPIPDPNPELKNKITQLIDQKNELLEENLNIKNQKLFAVQIHSINNKHFELIIPSSISGKHIFQKEDDYTQDQISKFITLSAQIDKECPDRDKQQLEATYNKKITSIIDSRMSNRDYRKHRPNYLFSA